MTSRTTKRMQRHPRRFSGGADEHCVQQKSRPVENGEPCPIHGKRYSGAVCPECSPGLDVNGNCIPCGPTERTLVIAQSTGKPSGKVQRALRRRYSGGADERCDQARSRPGNGGESCPQRKGVRSKAMRRAGCIQRKGRSTQSGTAKRYSGGAHEKCAPRRGKCYGGTEVGHIVAGFDAYGYPALRKFRLPKEYSMKGKRFSQTPQIQPMRLVTRDTEEPEKPGIGTINRFTLKPYPNVPGAPDSLPSQYKFCVQKGDAGYFLRFRDPKISMHGAHIEGVECAEGPDGMILCQVPMGGGVVEAPICEDPGGDKEPVPQACCVQLKGNGAGQLVCPGSAYDLLVVQVVPGTEHYVKGIKGVSVQHPDLPGGGARLPVCEPILEIPDERPCCIEEETGKLVCPEGFEFPLAGETIELKYLKFIDADEGRVAELACGDINQLTSEQINASEALSHMYTICKKLGGATFNVCEKAPPTIIPPGRRPPPTKIPPKFPDICCFDPNSSTLVCEGTPFHGLGVKLVFIDEDIGIVSVENPNIPGGGARLPICPPRPEIPKIPPVVKRPTGEEPPPPTVDTPDVPDQPPGKKLPTPTHPEKDVQSYCRQKWEEMERCDSVKEHCDPRHMRLIKKAEKSMISPGRRMSGHRQYGTGICPENRATGFGPGMRGGAPAACDAGDRRYGTGIPDESKVYAPLPGMRGGRRNI